MIDWYRPSAEKILVVAPHPDDEIIGCGGLMACLTGIPADITVLHLTCESPQRRSEASQAHRTIGIDDGVGFGWKDGGIKVGPDTVSQVTRLLDEMKPVRVFLPNVHDRHPDHAAAGQIFALALAKGAASPEAVLQYEGLRPLREANTYFDITRWAALKHAALACFETQERLYRLTELTHHLNGYRARTTLRRHCSFVEAYFQQNPTEFVAHFATDSVCGDAWPAPFQFRNAAAAPQSGRMAQ